MVKNKSCFSSGATLAQSPDPDREQEAGKQKMEWKFSPSSPYFSPLTDKQNRLNTFIKSEYNFARTG